MHHRGAMLGPSITLLRISLGVVFLIFGFFKFVPGLSPAESLVVATVEGLTMGLLPAGVGLFLVAAVETVIGLSLLTGRLLRLGLVLLAACMVGILSPLVLLPGELFTRPLAAPLYAPTLAGQFVIKDVVLLAAGLVVASGAPGPAAGSAAGSGRARDAWRGRDEVAA
jgi:putative oxidoreductase